MAVLRLFVSALFLSVVLIHNVADADGSSPDVEAEARSNGHDQFSSKIRSLESSIKEKTREIIDKDALIASKDNAIKEKSQNIASLESKVASLQENSDAVKQLGRANTRAGELEKQVEKLKKELATHIMDKHQLEAQANEVGKKGSELYSKADKLEKIVDEQKTKLRKTERALQIAEEEMMKAKFEATSKTKELMENWKLHGKPVLEPWMQKVLEKKAQAEEWIAPHVAIMRTKLEKWGDDIEPHVHRLTRKTLEMYEASKNTATIYFIKSVELADPYFQGLRRVSRPYIDQVATAARSHVHRLRVALHPYTKGPVRAYGKFLESATTYHYQVQDTVHEKLKSHELTKHLATKELVWFAASALLALPVIFLFRLFSALCCGKAKKPTRRSGYSRR